MKKIILLATIAASIMSSANEYKIIIGVKDSDIVFVDKAPETWSMASPEYSEWKTIGTPICGEWSPEASTIDEGTSFKQKSSGCTIEQQRTKQEREVNNQGKYRNVGSSILESQTLTDQEQERDSIGTSTISYAINFGAGRNISGGAYAVGAYARTNLSVDVGPKVFNENGDRVLIYYYRLNSTCEIRIGITAKGGWTPNVHPAKAMDYINKFNYVDIYNTNGFYKRYKLSVAQKSADGAYRNAAATCAEITNFYNAPTTLTKGELKKY